MELHHLRYLRAIARDGSLTRAARSLGVGQPTLTAAVQQIEAELDTRLLVRHARGVELTATGRELLAQAEQVLGLVEQIPQRIHDLELGLRGAFTVGCYESLGAWFLPSFVRYLIEELPTIELRLWNASSAQVRDAVLSGDIQFGLIVNAVPHPDLVIVVACHDVIEVVACAEFLAGRSVRDALVEGPLFFLDRAPFTHIIDRLAALGLLAERRVPCGDLELVKSFVLAGVGVGILPRRVAAYGHPGVLRSVEPKLPRFHDSIHLVYRGDVHRTRAAMALKQALVEHGRRIDAADPIEPDAV